MKVALIGAGSISSRHITMMKEIGEYQVIAIADPVFSLAKELAEPCGAKAYESIDNLLEDCQPELVDICSPAYLHYEHTLKCLSAGLNVFCEKPMTHTTEEADELIALAKEKGVFYMVGHVLRFWPEYEFLKKMIYKQPYGRLRYALFNRQYGTHRPGSWYMDPEKCKMAPFEMLIHDADYVNYVFGLPSSIISFGVEQPDIHLSYLCSTYRYDKYPDMVIQIEGGWNDSKLPFSCGYRATFEHAVLEFRDNKLTLYPSGEEPVKVIDFPENGKYTSAMAAIGFELKHVLECIKENKQSEKVGIQSTRDTIYLVSKEIESLQKNMEVFLKQD